MARFSSAFIKEIKQRIRLSDLIGQEVPLKQVGKEFRGLSPFKPEKTPSFMVNDEKGIFSCFATQTHGDAFKWMELRHGLNFYSAAEKLATLAGLTLETKIDSGTSTSELITAANQAAQIYWSGQLFDHTGEKARQYLNARGIDDDTAKKFGLGWAPASSDGLKKNLFAQGLRKEILLAAGLLSKNENTGFFCRRLIFPIRNTRARIIGFGGRCLPEAGPDSVKYLNTRDTPLFKKNASYYLTEHALSASAQSGRIVIAEGYFDAILMHRYKIADTVAALGTAIDTKTLRSTFSRARRFIFILDGDEAGQKAMDRVIDLCLPEARPDCAFFFAKLPQGKDPAEILEQENGLQILQTILDDAISLDAALWSRTLRQFFSCDLPENRAAVVGELLRCCNLVTHNETRAWYETAMVRRTFDLFGRHRNFSEIPV